MTDEQNIRVDDGANGVREVKVNYPGNSSTKQNAKPDAAKRDKAGEKKVERVTSSEVIQRKKGVGKKLSETFFAGESIPEVARFLFINVAVPSIQTLALDIVTQGLDRTLFGESFRRAVRTPAASRSTTYTPYNRMSSSSSSPAGRAGQADGPRGLSTRARASHDFSEIILENRGEAEEVLEKLDNLIRNYDVASVSDLYDLVGITGSFPDEKWGWYDLKGANIQRVRDGFLLNLPRTEPIE